MTRKPSRAKPAKPRKPAHVCPPVPSNDDWSRIKAAAYAEGLRDGKEIQRGLSKQEHLGLIKLRRLVLRDERSRKFFPGRITTRLDELDKIASILSD